MNSLSPSRNKCDNRQSCSTRALDCDHFLRMSSNLTFERSARSALLQSVCFIQRALHIVIVFYKCFIEMVVYLCVFLFKYGDAVAVFGAQDKFPCYRNVLVSIVIDHIFGHISQEMMLDIQAVC